MNVDQREAEIRRRVGRYLRMSIDEKMAAPGFAFGCMADEAFLVVLIDQLRRQVAHAPISAGAAPAAPPDATPATALQAVDGWSAEAALAAVATRVDAALVQAVRDNANPYETRARVAAAITGLRHGARPAPAPLPPDEPPPFVVG